MFLLHQIAFQPILDTWEKFHRSLSKPGAEGIGRNTPGHPQAKKHELAGCFYPVDFFLFDHGLVRLSDLFHIATGVFLVAPSYAHCAMSVRIMKAMGAGSYPQVVSAAPIIHVMPGMPAGLR